jgi:hypothetical protein
MSAESSRAPRPNPFDHRDRVRSLAPTIEALAADYWSRSRPLCDALSAVLAIPLSEQARWVDAVFAAGNAIREAGLSEWPASIRESDRGEGKGEDRELAHFGVYDAFAAAVEGDRVRVTTLCNQLGGYGKASAEAVSELRQFAVFLMCQCFTRNAPAFADRMRRAGEEIGETIHSLMRSSLMTEQDGLSLAAREAVRHWHEWQSELGGSGRGVPCYAGYDSYGMPGYRSGTIANPSLRDLADRRAADLRRQDEQRGERLRKLNALAVLHPLTASQVLAYDPENSRNVQIATRWATPITVPEIPPYRAMPDLPGEYIDALVKRISEVREALRTVYGDAPPRPGPPRQYAGKPEDEARWWHAQRWLYDTDLPAIQVEATELAGTRAGREELRVLVSVILNDLVWCLAQVLRCDIPPDSLEPESPEEWAEEQRKNAAFLESLQQEPTPANNPNPSAGSAQAMQPPSDTRTPTPLDPAALVQTFLNAVEPNANQLPDPFGDDFSSSGLIGGHAPPVRLRGLLAQLADEGREITRRLVWQRGKASQDFVGRGNSTAFDSQVRELYRQEEAERSQLRERWFCGLASADKAAIDDFCLDIAGSVVRPIFPSSVPASLHGPLARLALECATISRRAAAERQERERSLGDRGLGNRSVAESILGGFAHTEAEAKSRLLGRWFRELTPAQAAAFDANRPIGVTPPAAESAATSPDRAGGEGAQHAPAECRADVCAALENLITRLRHDPRILFEKKWDYEGGLDALTINDLVSAFGRGPVFELESHGEYKRLKVRHPDPGKLPITWTVWSRWEYLTEVADDKAAALNDKAKFTDTIEYLRRWRETAEARRSNPTDTEPEPQGSGELSPETSDAKLTPAELRAWNGYEQAERALDEEQGISEPTDRQAYQWLVANESIDQKETSLDAWVQALVRARKRLGKNKYQRRSSYTGRSAVPKNEYDDTRQRDDQDG